MQDIYPISENLGETLSNLFAREEFAATLLGRSFNQTIGWVELAAVAALSIVAWLAANFINKNKLNQIQYAWLKHLLTRAMLPFMLLLFGSAGLVAWWASVGADAVWLRLLVFAANWMLAIRLILGGQSLCNPGNHYAIKRSFNGTIL